MKSGKPSEKSHQPKSAATTSPSAMTRSPMR
jgi:hypothetical protein